jgi:hypothetical protein
MSGDIEIAVTPEEAAPIKASERARVAQFIREAVALGKPLDVDKMIAAIERDVLTVADVVIPDPPAQPAGDLVRRSWLAHAAAAEARRARVPAGLRRQDVQAALDLRLQAHALDPEHLDPVWAEEANKTPNGKDTHTELVAFYQQQLRLTR